MHAVQQHTLAVDAEVTLDASVAVRGSVANIASAAAIAGLAVRADTAVEARMVKAASTRRAIGTIVAYCIAPRSPTDTNHGTKPVPGRQSSQRSPVKPVSQVQIPVPDLESEQVPSPEQTLSAPPGQGVHLSPK